MRATLTTALSSMLAVQTMTSMAVFTVAVFAPAAAADIGVDATTIGAFMSIAYTVAMVAGLAAMEQYSAPAIARLEELGERAREVCRSAFRSAEMPGQVTGHGSLLRLHLTESP